jgi:hypothetical protein
MDSLWILSGKYAYTYHINTYIYMQCMYREMYANMHACRHTYSLIDGWIPQINGKVDRQT